MGIVGGKWDRDLELQDDQLRQHDSIEIWLGELARIVTGRTWSIGCV